MTTMAIIPARSGSKGVPDKNIKLLAGKHLIGFSIQAALLSRNVSRVIVSTDSEAYARIAREYGAEVPFLRPAEISTDASSDLDFFKHVVSWLQKHDGNIPELFVHLRPTTPFRDPDLISQAVETIKRIPEASALRSVHAMQESAYKTFEIVASCLRRVGSGSSELDAANNARQQFPKTYYANGYVDVVRSSLILKQDKLHGDKVHAFITPPVVEVDTQDDFDLLEYQALKYPVLVKKIFRD